MLLQCWDLYNALNCYSAALLPYTRAPARTLSLIHISDFFEFLAFITDWKGGIPDYEKFKEQLPKFITIAKILQNMGAKPFTDAYVVNSSFAAKTGKNRAEAFADIALSELWGAIDIIIDTVLIAESTSCLLYTSCLNINM